MGVRENGEWWGGFCANSWGGGVSFEGEQGVAGAAALRRWLQYLCAAWWSP